MRLVCELSHSGDGGLEDTVLDFIDTESETKVDLKSSPNLCTKNKMAAVFPSLSSSDKGMITLSKTVTVSTSKRNSDPMEGFSGSESMSYKLSMKDQPVLKDSTDGKLCVIYSNNNNNTPVGKIQNDEPRENNHDLKKRVESNEHVKERPSSGFHNTIVEALVERPKDEVDDRNGKKCVIRLPNISDCSDMGVWVHEKCCDKGGGLTASGESKCGDQVTKIPLCPSTVTSHSKMTNWTKENTVVVKTRACRDDASSSAEEHRLSDNSASITRGDAIDGCSVLLSEGSECLSQQAGNEKTTNTNCNQKLPDDVITTEAAPETSQVASSPFGQDRAGEVKQRLAARISNSLVNFFQRCPAKRSASTDTARTGRQGRASSTAAERKHGKNEAGQSSFAVKLKTSVTEWTRKQPNGTKSLPRDEKVNSSDVANKKNSKIHNKRRVPLFVSPQDQVEIDEDAPEEIMDHHKVILRESWSIIKLDVAEVGVEAFMGLFHTHPDSIDSFLAFKDKAIEDIEQSAVLKAHALRVMQTVDKCITRLDDMEKMSTVLCQLGRRHIGYRANASLISIIGKQFISAIEPKMEEKWSEDVRDAWTALFSTINYNMRLGMMQEKHRLKSEGVFRKRK